MKNLFQIFIIFILSFFIIGESKAEVPDVILGCDIVSVHDFENDTYHRFRYKTFIEIKGGSSPKANYYSYFRVRTQDSLLDEYQKWEYRIREKLTELILIRQNNGSDAAESLLYIINRETLIGRKEGFTESYDQCEILSGSNPIEYYINNHIVKFEAYLRRERNEQIRKNKI